MNTTFSHQIAWAAGLFEGEGCFTTQGPRPRAQMSSTDEDVVRRFATVVGFGRVWGPYGRAGVKPAWRWAALTAEEVQALIAMLWPWLGERRRDRAVEILHRCRLTHRQKRLGPVCTAEGCAEPPTCRDLCHRHYNLWWYHESGSSSLHAQHARRVVTHCKRGHEFTPENTHITPAGKRWCRACERHRYRQKKGG